MYIFGMHAFNAFWVLSLASAEAQGNVVRAWCISKGKPLFLTPASSQTIHPMEMRIGMVHYVRGFNKCAKSHHATYRGSAPTHTWNIKVVSFVFYFIFFLVFSEARAQPERKDRSSWLMAQNACFDVRKCLLGVWSLTKRKWGRGSLQTPNYRPRNANSPLKKNR
jgi:hypothetical protein